MPADPPAQLWRVPARVRRFAVAVSLFFVVVALGATAVGLSVGGSLVMWALAFLVGLSIWRWYLVPYVALTDERVVVRGVFAQRSVGYDEISRVRPGLYGMRIETRDEGSFIAWAVQKSKFAEWSHRHTRADDVVTAIMARVEHSGSRAATRSA